MVCIQMNGFRLVRKWCLYELRSWSAVFLSFKQLNNFAHITLLSNGNNANRKKVSERKRRGTSNARPSRQQNLLLQSSRFSCLPASPLDHSSSLSRLWFLFERHAECLLFLVQHYHCSFGGSCQSLTFSPHYST